MYKGWVFVDVDGTLIDKDDNPRPYIKELFASLKRLNLILVVWSGGGRVYAENQVRKLGKEVYDYVDEFRWKGTPVSWNHIRPVFFIDDSDYIEKEHAIEGSGVFKVPFYEATTMKDDAWLLSSYYEVEKFYYEYGSGGHKKDSIV